MVLTRALLALSISVLAATATFPPAPDNVTVLQSTKFPGVSISFKEVNIVRAYGFYTTDDYRPAYARLPKVSRAIVDS